MSEPKEEIIQGKVPDLKPEQIVAPLSIFDELSEEEILYWSTPYFDELLERKQMQKKALEENK